MKKYPNIALFSCDKIILFVVLFLMFDVLTAQIVASGLYVSQGATFYAGDGLKISNSGGDSLLLAGTLVVEDSFVVSNPALSKSGGKLVLSGSSSVFVKADGLRLDTLEISTSNDKAGLTQNIAVNRSLAFTSGNLYLNSHKLVLGPNATIKLPNSYPTPVPIVANNRGEVVLEGLSGGSSLYIPMGYGNQYLNAISLGNAQTGATDTFSVAVVPNVLESGTSGNAITNDVVQASWMIDDSANAAYQLQATLHWNAAQEGTGFDNTKSAVAHFDNNSWHMNGTHLTNASTHSINSTNLTDIENIVLTVADASSSLVDVFELSVKLFLQGPYNSSIGKLDTSLNIKAYIPHTAAQAYGAAPFNYKGNETNASAPLYPGTNIVDWVLVELRDAPTAAQATASKRLATVAGFLLNDGRVVSADGSTALNTGEISVTDSLFIVVRHRNHLDVMSAVPLVRTGEKYNYDFTTALTKAYGSNAMAQLDPMGVYGLWAGDVNADGVVKYTGTGNDVSIIFNGINGNVSVVNTLSGYYGTDVNMEGVVKYTGTYNDVSVIFNVIDGNDSVVNTRTSQVP